MSTNVVLFYFSGTSNTKVVTHLIKESFIERKISVDIYDIEDIINRNVEYDISKYNMVGIGHPVYGFGSPTIVDDFVKSMPISKIKTFIYKTAGDFLKVNHNASGRLIRNLTKKGYNVMYDRIICMGSNFFLQYDDELVKSLYESAVKKTSHMVDEILSDKIRMYSTSHILIYFTNITNDCEDKFFARLFGKSLKVTENCINCGKCIKNCPSKNIYVDNGKIKFKWNCYLCMRCIYDCPTNAITSVGCKSVILKDGYNIKKIINSDMSTSLNDSKINNHFKEYLENEAL